MINFEMTYFSKWPIFQKWPFFEFAFLWFDFFTFLTRNYWFRKYQFFKVNILLSDLFSKWPILNVTFRSDLFSKWPILNVTFRSDLFWNDHKQKRKIQIFFKSIFCVSFRFLKNLRKNFWFWESWWGGLAGDLPSWINEDY